MTNDQINKYLDERRLCWDPLSSDFFHNLTKPIQLAEGCVHVGRYSDAGKLFVNDWRGKDVVLTE